MSVNKTKVDSVITSRGFDIIVRTYVVSGNDKWGKVTTTSSTDRTIRAVKDSYLSTQATLNALGRTETSTLNIIVMGTENFNTSTDKIVINSLEYNILQINPLELRDLSAGEETLAKILTVGLA